MKKSPGRRSIPMTSSLAPAYCTPGSSAARTRMRSIKAIDVSKAEELPGVKVVVTGEDFPKRIGLYLVDKHIFARERVRFIGEPVAAVAAITEDIAEKALDLIEVEYEPLEAVFDPVLRRQSGSTAHPSGSGRVRCSQLHLPTTGHEYRQPFQSTQR